jgi:hypothetical protein
MFAQKLKVEVVINGERKPCPLAWLDAFFMRNFTGAEEFDETLPVDDGQMEASLRVDLRRVEKALADWITSRGKSEGKPVRVIVTPAQAP